MNSMKSLYESDRLDKKNKIKEMLELHDNSDPHNIYKINDGWIEIDLNGIEDKRKSFNRMPPTHAEITLTHSKRLEKFFNNERIEFPRFFVLISLKIRDIENNTYKNIRVIDKKGTFLFNTDDIPQFFWGGVCEKLYFDIDVNDKSTYVFEYDTLDYILFDSDFHKWFLIFLDIYRNKIFYVIGDRVLVIRAENGEIEIIPKSEFPEDVVSTFISFSSDAKSASKSAPKYANKRSI